VENVAMCVRLDVVMVVKFRSLLGCDTMYLCGRIPLF